MLFTHLGCLRISAAKDLDLVEQIANDKSFIRGLLT